MLYGNLIFIKKTGGDGSKFPVTEKNIKIGRSENCLIRIYNPQVAPEHCQLIIDINGQAKLRNLFTPTILNGKPLGQGDVTLCHGDVFKLGERLARWEYLPTSKYFRQLLSPAGRLVAVVNPQRRSVEIPGTSAGQVLVNKGTSIGNKRKISEKFSAENPSVAKQRRTIGSDASLKSKIEMGKHLLHSIKGGKVVIKTPIIKQRKSVAGIISSKTPKSKPAISRKSTLPSWKVSIDSQSSKKSQPKKTPPKRSLKNEVRTPSKSTPIKVKTPKRLKDVKTADKTALKTIIESPPKSEELLGSTRSFSKSPPAKVLSTPKRKSPVHSVRLIQSEKKPRSRPGTSKANKAVRKMSLVLKRVDGNEEVSLEKEFSASVRKSTKISSNEDEAEVELSNQSNSSPLGSPPQQPQRKSVKGTPIKTPRKSIAAQSSVKKSAKDIIETPLLIDFSDDSLVDRRRTNRESVISPRKPIRQSSARSVDLFQTPMKSSDEVETCLGKSTGKKPRSAAVSPVSTSSVSGKSGVVSSSNKVLSAAKEKASPRGVRRKLNPLICSAERAAKKLKTSNPKKPDKNKRAALLVLGKASRKQLLSQNVKVLLKQKIVKKAIKQSVILPARKNEKTKPAVRMIKKASKTKKSTKTSSTNNVSTPTATSKVEESSIESKPVNDSENRKSSERSSLSRSKILSPVTPAKPTSSSTSVKSSPKSYKKAESVLSPKSTSEISLPFVTFDKTSESYVLNSNRRSSKRLSSKNDTERPDFVELSPTALGLIPKNIEMFKTPKERKRKSSSLVTPKNVRTTGIIKSASTSKIANRKSVSFLSKDLSLSSTPYTPNINDKTDFDFESFHTSNITMDVFISPLDKSTAKVDESMKQDKRRSSVGSKKVIRKLLQTPQKEPPAKSPKLSEQNETPKSNIGDSGVGKARKSPKNDLSDFRGVARLMKTPKQAKSPKNDITNVGGVKRLFSTPKAQKSPKNDLSDVKGVKKLMRTPKVQKSPKNDLSDVRGVKKLMTTPKQQKSPKNDLSDVKGVKKLMQTPKKQKSPKNELVDLRGLKNLLKSPKIQKSPKNDLTDVTGVKQLLKTPKVQKNPKNDLSDVTGVRELFARHKPISDYNVNLTGIAELFEMFKIEQERGGTESINLKDTKTVRGRSRKLDVEKEEKVATTPKGQPKKADSVEVETRSTRSRKQVTFEGEKETREPTTSRSTRTKKAEPVKKTRTKKEEIAEEEARKNLRKRKAEEVEPSPPKLRRKVAASKTASKEPKAVAKSKNKAKEITEAKSTKKTAAKSKTPTKVSKVQSKATKSGVNAQKVQTTRSQSQSKESPKSRSKSSPRKTRSVKAKSSAETRTTSARRKK